MFDGFIYFTGPHQLQFISHITVNVTYTEPLEPLLTNPSIYDLLILTPQSFLRSLEPLVAHKEAKGIKTQLVSLEEVNERMFWFGRDQQEKIKYYIKHAIEYWGVTHVLLVGGRNKQTLEWHVPVRYSHVVPCEEQEYAEQSFLSDLYYADIYDSVGGFSSWDSNNNDIFAEWNETYQEEMDLYPDVYLGRLACRNNYEVKVMVNKIIHYEEDPCDESWFTNFLLVAGDSYDDVNHFNEGELISELSIEYMPGLL